METQQRNKQMSFIHSIRFQVILAITLFGISSLLGSQFMLIDSLTKLEEQLIGQRLESDINYIQDLIGDGEWNIRDGALYRGDILIGDGTKEKANLAPFLLCEERTQTFSYTFILDSDEGLGWTGDQVTGYQQGHYLRVAGSTLNPAGESIVGTWMEKSVADQLDQYGFYEGAANVDGGMIYCIYRTLNNAQGEIVGAVVVGRNISELEEQVNSVARVSAAALGLVLMLIYAGISLIFNRWIRSVERIRNYLDEIAKGVFPEQPLLIDRRDELGIIANSINNSTEVLKEKERLSAELSTATTIQAHMLPCIFPPFPERSEFDVYATMTPAREVAGDFYDFFMIDDDHMAAVVADVSGKGVPAALFMVIAKTLIKNQAQLGKNPCEVFTTVNRMLCEDNEAGLFVTAWMCELELSTGKLTYVNAGHNPPLVLSGDQGFRYLDNPPGFVLAGLESIQYEQQEIYLDPGDRLFLYTDGVTEATSAEKELYGEDRLLHYLNEHPREKAMQVLPGLREDIERFVGEAEQFDDITMLMLDYFKKGGN